MPAPYPLIEIPAGDANDIFDKQAMTMAMLHNVFIRGVNSIAAHATAGVPESKVLPFMQFCHMLADMVHHHHHNEESLYFPDLEKKLGTDTMASNVEQHHAFFPHLDKFSEYVKEVKGGKRTYVKDEFLASLAAFMDPLTPHLHEEIVTLESSRLSKVMTKEEMRVIEQRVEKQAIADASLAENIPLMMACHDRFYGPPMRDPLPWILKFAVRVWFFRKHAASWEFAPCDFHGRLKTQVPSQPLESKV